MRISPDGLHVAFTQLVLNSNPQHPNFRYVGVGAVIVTLIRTAPGYEIVDAVVIYAIGEVKQCTPDGQGVVVLGGQYEIGNLDDVVVNLDNGAVTRVTANLDYDEDMDYSPEPTVDRDRKHAHARCADADVADCAARVPAPQHLRSCV